MLVRFSSQRLGAGRNSAAQSWLHISVLARTSVCWAGEGI